MGLNDTPAAERTHIALFGKRNAGKSSLLNALTGQPLAVVSDVPGTTTDPVAKAMELLPLGPVVLLDTPGLDDLDTPLGLRRVQSARRVLNKADIAVLVADSEKGLAPEDRELLQLLRDRKLPALLVFNKADLAMPSPELRNEFPESLTVSAETGFGIDSLKERLASLTLAGEPAARLLDGLVEPGDTVLLVTPIDSAAPKGRLILPQQQTLRDALDRGAFAVVTRETELPAALDALRHPPKLVITDSQAFGAVARALPPGQPLTSFSILFSRYKGYLAGALDGIRAVAALRDDSRVLISEGCTHRRQCGDIGTQKIPRWLTEFTGKKLRYEFTGGTAFPDDLSGLSLIVHCGGCMLTEREMRCRARCAADQGIPLTNYGMLIAHVHGLLARSLEPIPECRGVLR